MTNVKAAFGLLLGATLSLSAQRPTAAPSAGRAAGIVNVVIETTMGNIAVALDSAHAPITVTNFLHYVDGRFYDGGQFHRSVRADNQPTDSVKIGVIQASIEIMRVSDRRPPILLETTQMTHLKHLDGTISMARTPTLGAQTDFFICVGDQPALDLGGHRIADGKGFAAFGHVTSGMDVVRAIQASKVQAQTLTPPITITHIRRASGGG